MLRQGKGGSIINMASISAYIGTGAVIQGDVNRPAALSAGGCGFVIAVLLALTGLPEADETIQ